MGKKQTKKKPKKKKALKMSQSLMKMLFKYKIKEECGLVLKARYVDNIQSPSSPAMELGNYFEYICTGDLARDGHTPEVVLLKSGKPSTPYARMDIQKENFDAIMKTYNLDVKHTGYVFNHSKYGGIADIIAWDKENKRHIIIDVKTSGLLNDKWSEWGWANDSIEYKDELLIQAVHYKMLFEEEFKEENVPFYFFVFSTTNEWEVKIFDIEVSEDTMHTHKMNLENAVAYFESENKKGWKPHPTYAKCRNCALKPSCKSFIDVPLAQKVYY